MKFSIILSAILLTFGWVTSSPAQLIEAQQLDNSQNKTFTFTLTSNGPVQVMATANTYMTLEIDGSPFESNIGNSGSNTLSAVINLSPGNHALTLFSNSSNEGAAGIAMIIAPNEPLSGISSSIQTLQSAVSTLQASEQSDADLIATLQASQVSQAAQISAFQMNEAAGSRNDIPGPLFKA